MRVNTAYTLSVLAGALPWAFASAVGEAGNGNLTIALFPDSQESACKGNDITKALTLTTRDVPTGYTCFNVSDIFSQNRTTGFQNARGKLYYHNHTIIQPNGVSWFLQNLDLYDRKANYSTVWFAQGNMSEVEAGKPAAWVFYTYAFPNCRQVSRDKDRDEGDDPWFEASCQTAKDGECHINPEPVVSFAINTAEDYNAGGKCKTWAKLGAAARIGGHVGALAIGLAALAVAVAW